MNNKKDKVLIKPHYISPLNYSSDEYYFQKIQNNGLSKQQQGKSILHFLQSLDEFVEISINKVNFDNKFFKKFQCSFKMDKIRRIYKITQKENDTIKFILCPKREYTGQTQEKLSSLNIYRTKTVILNTKVPICNWEAKIMDKLSTISYCIQTPNNQKNYKHNKITELIKTNGLLDKQFIFIINESGTIIYNKVLNKETILSKDSTQICNVKTVNHLYIKALDDFYEANKLDTKIHLLTKSTVFVSHEPCPMCGMAFVHSRISLLYYIHNVEIGSLYTSININDRLDSGNKLNHTFTVFKMNRNSECFI